MGEAPSQSKLVYTVSLLGLWYDTFMNVHKIFVFLHILKRPIEIFHGKLGISQKINRSRSPGSDQRSIPEKYSGHDSAGWSGFRRYAGTKGSHAQWIKISRYMFVEYPHDML